MATEIKKGFTLVNREGAEPLDLVLGESATPGDYVFTDWDLDINGNIRLLEQQNSQVQSTLKNIFTEKQANGYGTHIYDLVGQKDIAVRRGTIFMDISLAMMVQKQFAAQEKERQKLNPADVISTITQLSVSEDSTDPSLTRITMRIKDESGVQSDIAVA